MLCKWRKKEKKKEIKEKRKSLDSRAQGTKTSCFPFYREERKRRSEKRDSSVYTAGQWIKEYAGPRLWALIERHVLAMMVLVLRGRPWQRRSVSFGRPGCLPLNEFGANLPIFERFEVDIDELKNLAELPRRSIIVYRWEDSQWKLLGIRFGERQSPRSSLYLPYESTNFSNKSNYIRATNGILTQGSSNKEDDARQKRNEWPSDRS